MTTATQSVESPTLRADARDNRDRILGVARAIFATEGLDVTMREIARRAEVGVATLYRRFPTKESLVVVAFAGQMAACAAIVDEGLADPDPWHGFCTVIDRVCALHALDRGFTAAFTTTFPDAPGYQAVRQATLGNFAELTRRAKAAGRLRPDFVLDDLILVLMANGGIRTASPGAAVAAVRRFAALLIQSFHAQPGLVPLPPPVRLSPLPGPPVAPDG